MRRRAKALETRGLAETGRSRQRARELSYTFNTSSPRALLFGTGLASTLFLGAVAMPAPAHALQTCQPFVGTGPTPISINDSDDIICVNTEPRNGGPTPNFPLDEAAIYLRTYGVGDFDISLNNSGVLSSTNAAGAARGIQALTNGLGHDIDIVNSASITATTTGFGNQAFGIFTGTLLADSPVTITNSGDIIAGTLGDGGYAAGIKGETEGGTSPIVITNQGALRVNTRGNGARADGIEADTAITNSHIAVNNTGDIWAETLGRGALVSGIDGRTTGTKSRISVTNDGDIWLKSAGRGAVADGITALTENHDSRIRIENSGDISVETLNFQANADAISARATGDRSSIETVNHGDLWVSTKGTDAEALGIDAYTGAFATGSPISIVNNGDLWVSTQGDDAEAFGIDAGTGGFTAGSPITIVNSGDMWVSTQGEDAEAYGIDASAGEVNSRISVVNSGDLWVSTKGTDAEALGIEASTGAATTGSPINIVNHGAIHVVAEGDEDRGGPIAFGIDVSTGGEDSPIHIVNSGSVYAAGGSGDVGILAFSYVANPVTIENTGEIGAKSHLAIDVKSAGTADIFNAGLITGFVDLTEQNDRFFNQSGGVFETKKTSLFGGGNDLFVNERGGTVLAATDRTMSEMSSFQGLETFRNRGLISMLDGQAGDSFRISNTPGGTDLNFEGGGQLGLDVFLDGAASPADKFFIEGNVSGTTTVIVNNTNLGPGTFNPDGIPVIFVDGNTPSESNFQLLEPIDTGLFDYDLFFVPTNSGFWELRSFVGGSAQALPKLLTAAQDLWHQTSATWFDRTADLRVVLNGGSAPGGAPTYDGSSNGLAPGGLTPGVWMKGGGSRLDRDGSATTSAYGRTYNYDLDNEFSSFDLQVGVDMGQYDVLSQGDVLIYGVLGGYVGGNLDYESLTDTFKFSGGQVGAYATYLKDGLFVDTLLNVHILEIDTPNLGFPGGLDATTFGIRTDAGYRFGSFTGGAFFEPLATIEVTWADIDGFNVGGNSVSFSDDANVRGRIGGRVGTTMQAWEGTMMEPFLIASLWGNLSDDNAARLVSNGTTFNFQDDLDDVWGEISGGVNLFNFSQSTSVFAKVDYTFGEDVQGIGGKGGVRVAW
ncbi:MAG: autotransporter domain-containing protein [Methyloceanibacter sp.]|nr:autotransporter domain-containing protein [Methyloceanibacter sp.]